MAHRRSGKERASQYRSNAHPTSRILLLVNIQCPIVGHEGEYGTVDTYTIHDTES